MWGSIWGNWAEVAGISHYIIVAVIAALAMLFAGYMLMRRRKRKTQKLNDFIYFWFNFALNPNAFASFTCNMQSTSDASFNTL